MSSVGLGSHVLKHIAAGTRRPRIHISPAAIWDPGPVKPVCCVLIHKMGATTRSTTGLLCEHK